MVDRVVRIEGAKKIQAIAIALRHMGEDRTIINEMTKRIRRAAGPLRAAVKSMARAILPKLGGLGVWVSRANIRVSVKRSSRYAGVSLFVGKDSIHGRTDMVAIDAGKVRHPTYGNRKHWSLQAVTPGFATNVMHGSAADRFQADTLAAVDAAVAQVLHGLQ